jgi:hypothetical protein
MAERRREIEKLMKNCPSPDILNKSGAVLYNGWSSLADGRLYVMGLNPGGDPEEIGKSVVESLGEVEEDHSELGKEWSKSHRGLHPLQKRVIELLKIFWKERDIEEEKKKVFWTNAIFLRSINANILSTPLELWDMCWPIHQYFLSIIKPEIILCLGNGERLSAFSMIRSKSEGSPSTCFCDPKTKTFRDGKHFDATLPIMKGTISTKVVGVPHPSRFPVTAKLKEFLGCPVK